MNRTVTPHPARRRQQLRELSAAVANGQYHPEPQVVAHAIIQRLRDSLVPMPPSLMAAGPQRPADA
jgi:hypothetical protein